MKLTPKKLWSKAKHRWLYKSEEYFDMFQDDMQAQQGHYEFVPSASQSDFPLPPGARIGTLVKEPSTLAQRAYGSLIVNRYGRVSYAPSRESLTELDSVLLSYVAGLVLHYTELQNKSGSSTLQEVELHNELFRRF